MKKMRIALAIIVACLFLLGLSGSGYTITIFDEPFDNLDNWIIGGDGTSEIDPAGQLHQIGPNVSRCATISQTLASGVGTGDYTFEMKFLLNSAPTIWNSFRVDIGGETNTLMLYWYDDSLRTWDDTSIINALSKTWSTDTWYTLRGAVYNNQSLCDFYLDDILQSTGVDVSWGYSNNGFLRLASNINGVNIGDEWHVDYFKIYNGEIDDPDHIPEPATMLILGSLATGLFGVAGIRRKHR